MKNKKLCVNCKYYKVKPEYFGPENKIEFHNHYCTYPDAQDIVTGEHDVSCYDARQGQCDWFNCGVDGKYWEEKNEN